MAFGGFGIFALIEGAIFRHVSPDVIGGLDEIVAQVSIAGFGEVAVLGLELTGSAAGPPEASEFGDALFGIREGARAFDAAVAVELGTRGKRSVGRIAARPAA